MVQYEGHVTEEGELLVNLQGRQVTLHEFLQATRIRSERRRIRVDNESRRLTNTNFALAK
ncbi:MAG TPA: hypothetical protein VF168_11970 [Trueperaceae bacterium]